MFRLSEKGFTMNYAGVCQECEKDVTCHHDISLGDHVADRHYFAGEICKGSNLPVHCLHAIEKKPALSLNDFDFPDCVKRCLFFEMGGVSECESICPDKFE